MLRKHDKSATQMRYIPLREMRYTPLVCDISATQMRYIFLTENAKVCSCGAIIIYVKPTFKAHIKLPKAYLLRDLSHIARHHKLRLTLSVRYHEKLFCSAVAPLSQKAILPFGTPLVHIAPTKLTYRDKVIYFLQKIRKYTPLEQLYIIIVPKGTHHNLFYKKRYHLRSRFHPVRDFIRKDFIIS